MPRFPSQFVRRGDTMLCSHRCRARRRHRSAEDQLRRHAQRQRQRDSRLCGDDTRQECRDSIY